MDIDQQNNKDDGVRGEIYELESELVGDRGRTVRDRDHDQNQVSTRPSASISLSSGAGLPPFYGLPERNSPAHLAGRDEENIGIKAIKEHDSYFTSFPCLDHGIRTSSELGVGSYGGARGNGNDHGDNDRDRFGGNNSTYAVRPGEEVDLHTGIPREKEVADQGQRRRISIDDLLTGSESTLRNQQPNSQSALSTPSSISPATPEDNPAAYHHYQPGSIHSPVPLPLPLRARSSFGSTARPISHRRPGPIYTPSRSRASPYHLTSAARYEGAGTGVGLGINMMNSPSTPGSGPMTHSDSPLGPAQSPGSMSARRRKAPEWPELKSARSHSFNSATASVSASTPRDMYQTLKTPAALRVPSTAQLLQRPGDMHSPMLIPGSASGSASGVGPMRRGIPPSSAPPLSAARVDTQSPIPQTPRRVHLLDVPRAKVISTLNERAGKYWFDPCTSDCRICEFTSNSVYYLADRQTSQYHRKKQDHYHQTSLASHQNQRQVVGHLRRTLRNT